MTDFQSRQRQSMADLRRSAFAADCEHEWRRQHGGAFSCLWCGKPAPYVSSQEASNMTDAIAAEAQRQRQQAEAIRQMNADMADLVEFAKAGEFREQG
jgi:hypothetical protein